MPTEGKCFFTTLNLYIPEYSFLFYNYKIQKLYKEKKIHLFFESSITTWFYCRLKSNVEWPQSKNTLKKLLSVASSFLLWQNIIFSLTFHFCFCSLNRSYSLVLSIKCQMVCLVIWKGTDSLINSTPFDFWLWALALKIWTTLPSKLHSLQNIAFLHKLSEAIS